MKLITLHIITFTLLLFIVTPEELPAAEVLQISSSNILQIGDNNRIYSVQLSCIEVDPKNEDEARKLLKKKLPRRSKVNLHPKGLNDNGTLLARVNLLNKENDLSSLLVSSGLAVESCHD